MRQSGIWLLIFSMWVMVFVASVPGSMGQGDVREQNGGNTESREKTQSGGNTQSSGGRKNDQQQNGQAKQKDQTPPQHIGAGKARLSRIQGFDLITAQGQVWGKIEDFILIIEGKESTVPYVVVEFDRDGATKFVVMLHELSFDWAKAMATIDIPADRIDSLPAMENVELPDTGTKEWDQSLHEYWQDLEDISGERSGMAVLSSQLMDYDVVNKENKDLGGIQDIVVNTKSGDVEYLAVSAGSFLGIGGDLVAVSLSEFEVNQKEKILILNIPEDVLKDIEGFKEDSWPQSAPVNWKQQNQETRSGQTKQN